MRLTVLLFLMTGAAAQAQSPPLRPELSGLRFLLGTWSNGRGIAQDAGLLATGTSSMTLEAGGALILRRDHITLLGDAGKPVRSFDALMTITAEAGAVHADYVDPDHIIHYTSAVIGPGDRIVFSTAGNAVTPTFRLSYMLTPQHTLAVSFMMAPPGSAQFHPIATGTLTRDVASPAVECR